MQKSLENWYKRVTNIYLTSDKGYLKYCMHCSQLLKIEDIEQRNHFFQLRILCTSQRCIK